MQASAHRVLLTVILACMLPASNSWAEASLGGLSVLDDLSKVFSVMKNPAAIGARRMDTPNSDYAVMVYQRQGATYVGLTNVGDEVQHILTESSSLTTNDGLKVGDARSLVVSKRGQPEETGEETPGITEYWYWSQGINFGIDKARDRIANIYIFPPTRATGGTQRVALPSNWVDVSHQYKAYQGKGYIVGRLSNRSPSSLDGVKLGFTFYDGNGHSVDVAFTDSMKLPRSTSLPFKISIPPKGDWTSYHVDVQSSDVADRQEATVARDKKLLSAE